MHIRHDAPSGSATGDALTLAIGTGGGAGVGALMGVRRGGGIGALVGLGSSALYTYKCLDTHSC
jgi:hypothetical protein